MRWEIVRVPENPPCSSGSSPSTVNVLAAAVEPKSANALVRQLSQVAPLENLRHVKRVRRRSDEGRNELHVILCPASEDENIMEDIPAGVLELIGAHNLSPFVAKVAKFAASSREEWQDQCKLWPTSYHPPCSVDGITMFSDEDSKFVCKFMKIAIDLSKVGQLHKHVVNAAVIVDPSNGQIIASARDEISTNSTSESCGDAGSIVYSSANASDCESSEPSHCCKCVEQHTGVACMYPWNWMMEKKFCSQESSDGSYSWHPLRHVALVAIESASTRDRQLFPNIGFKSAPISKDETLPFLDKHSAKRQKTITLSNNNVSIQQAESDCMYVETTKPYLCTGFDIYLVWEPCTMCAMALVHQRFRRIFFAFPNANAGALGSVYRLHGEKSLNHHYSAFRVMIPNDAFS